MKNFSRVYAAQPHYLNGQIVTIETDITQGLHAFSIVGLPDKAVEEARDRVGSALKNSGFTSPKQKNQKTVVSLAPAELKKEGSFFDVAIALGYLLAAKEIRFDPSNKLFLGELSLNGEIKPVRGVLALVQAAKLLGLNEVFVPQQNAEEAALIDDIIIHPVQNLKELIRHLDHRLSEEGEGFVLLATQPKTIIDPQIRPQSVDFADVRGQEAAKRGLEIAAAGGHNVAMYGPPGTGKTMLAKAFTGILPVLESDEQLEVTAIHSIAGTLSGIIMQHPPLRSPHHTSSYVSVIGGGSHPAPGEVTLAHRGVLFLDEFPEFDKRVLESLRQPLEDRIVHISRAKGSATFPAGFILVAAMNPCPCGFYGAEHKSCVCTPGNLARYRRKVSGPIMDRIDIWLQVEHVDYKRLSDTTESGEPSSAIRTRIEKARSVQQRRFALHPNITLNSQMKNKHILSAGLTSSAEQILQASARKLALSPRSYHRIIKLARTIADLGEAEHITDDHILEALQYRPRTQ